MFITVQFDERTNAPKTRKKSSSLAMNVDSRITLVLEPKMSRNLF